MRTLEPGKPTRLSPSRLEQIVVALFIITVFAFGLFLGYDTGYEKGTKEQVMKDMIQHKKDWPEEVKAIKEMICPK